MRNHKTRIFISYRRADLDGHAEVIVGRIADRLSGHFGGLNVFLDIDTIPSGREFDEFIDEQVAQADVVLAIFGIHALRVEEDSDDENVEVNSNHSILMATFLLISVAEFGDKTQIAVVALSRTSIPIAVWLGSTMALITTSALGVLAGRTILQRIPITLLHRISGAIFNILTIFTAYKTYMAL